MHVLNNRQLFKDWISEKVRQIYGTGEGGYGPYSVRTYLEFMCRNKSWGDQITCYLIASMWGCQVSVLRGDICVEVHFRHKLSLDQADICLLFNSDLVNGHYSCLLRDDESFLICHPVKESTGCDRNVDVQWERNEKAKELDVRIPQGELGKVASNSEACLVDWNVMQEMFKNQQNMIKIKGLLEGITVPAIGSANGRSSSRLVEESSEDEMEVGDDVPLFYEKGQTYSEFCKRDLGTTKALRAHNKKYHLGKKIQISV